MWKQLGKRFMEGFLVIAEIYFYVLAASALLFIPLLGIWFFNM